MHNLHETDKIEKILDDHAEGKRGEEARIELASIKYKLFRLRRLCKKYKELVINLRKGAKQAESAKDLHDLIMDLTNQTPFFSESVNGVFEQEYADGV